MRSGDMDDDPEDGAFDKNEISKICVKAMKNAIPDDEATKRKNLAVTKVEGYVNAICENVLKELGAEQEKNMKEASEKSTDFQAFKYVVTAHVQQRTGAGFITGCSTYWDKTSDDWAVAKYETDTLQAMVTVFGARLAPVAPGK
jgi:hypothetical protein